MLLEGFVLVAPERPSARLEIVGPIATYPLSEIADREDRALVERLRPFYRRLYEDELRARIAKLGLSERVEIARAVTREALIQRYYAADVFAFPPLWDEGFGLPVVEAMAAGRPVVATCSGALVETVEHARTGLVAEKADAEGLAAALVELLADDGRREAMGRAGRARALARSWDASAAALLAALAELAVG